MRTEILIVLDDGVLIAAQAAEIDGNRVAVPVSADALAQIYPEAQAVADAARLLAENRALTARVSELTVTCEELQKQLPDNVMAQNFASDRANESG